MTLMTESRRCVTPQVKQVAKTEKMDEEKLRRLIAGGRVVIPFNPIHSPKPVAIGEGCRVKVNANVGTSPGNVDIAEEEEKVRVALRYGADAVMDLSIDGDLDEIRRRLLRIVDLPFGSVPIYQAGIEAAKRRGAVVDMTEDDMFNAFEKHAKQGIDFVVAHCGVTRESVERLKRQGRLLDMVSRGGVFHAAWIIHNDEENPIYKNFDYLLELAKEYDLTLSLGDGMRSGAVYDANDRAKIQELLIIGELVERARKAGVQTIVEGPGHMPLNTIQANIEIMKSVTRGAPYYVLGPLVTDIAPGYDHIAGAIGGALAGFYGADFLCYVTPSEHLRLPTVEDVKQGVIAAKIAAHAANLARGLDWDRDVRMSEARRDLDWQGMYKESVDPETARVLHESRKPERGDYCSMCGELCAIKLIEAYLRGEKDVL